MVFLIGAGPRPETAPSGIGANWLHDLLPENSGLKKATMQKSSREEDVADEGALIGVWREEKAAVMINASIFTSKPNSPFQDFMDSQGC
jgi:hypothetical protein